MKRFSLLGFVLCWALLLAAMTPAANADVWNKKTYFTFPHKVEVPGGVVLEPGKYVFKLADSMSNRHIVQIFNERENHVYATILAISAQRMNPADKTILTFYEMPGDAPEPVRQWFYPGDTIGQEFAYPKKRALEISQAVHMTVPISTQITETAVTETKTDESLTAVVQPPPVIEEKTEEAETQLEIAQEFPVQANQAPPRVEEDADQEPVLMAQATPPPAAPPAQEPEMPKTASYVPLVGLAGLTSILGAIAVRRFARR